MHSLAYKVHAAQEVAKQEILDALHRCEGDRDLAAKMIGVSLRTLYRYIQVLKMYPEIDEAYERWGFEKFGGPPRKHT